jgi:hypothetical protein
MTKLALSSTTKTGTSVASSNEHQQSRMANTCDQNGTIVEAREVEKQLERQATVAPVAIRKNKSETIVCPCRLMEMINWCESEQADKE